MRRSMIFAVASVLAAAGTTVYLGSSASAATACAPAWSATAVYVGGNTASQNGHNYSAKWWTQNESPATHSGQWDVWADGGACGGGTTPPPTTAPPTTAPPTTAPPTTAPPTTAPPTTPPPPPPNTGIPKHALIGYLHETFANGSGYMKMSDVPSNWDIIDLAFGEPSSATSGDIHFTRCSASECPGVESDADFQAAIKAKQAAGKKVLLSIGGANGEVQLTTTAARDKFVSSVSAIIDRWGLNGLDVDFEGHSLSLNTGDTDFKNPTTPVIVNLISALKSLKARYGAGFVLTMAPETFFVQLGYQFYGSGPFGGQDPRAGSFLPVIYAMRNDLTILHVQDYNSGPIMGLDNQYHNMGGADFHIAMTDMLVAGFPVAGNTASMFPALRPDQVAFGAPATVNAGNGYVAPAAVQQAFGCLAKGTNCGGYTLRGGAHSDLRGLMTWSINWDHFNGYEFQNQNGAYIKSIG
ncbi:chitinase [Actinoplanes sp. NPDC051343]|uniref:chitinase n=1 Tax=Actinoplanes sp. NPDC051343 TaxID=3363906 RepID=UPI0037B7E71A